MMAVPLAVALEDPTASAVLVVSGEDAETVRLPELEEKGQWKGIEDDVPVPDEVGPGPWKGAEVVVRVEAHLVDDQRDQQRDRYRQPDRAFDRAGGQGVDHARDDHEADQRPRRYR